VQCHVFEPVHGEVHGNAPFSRVQRQVPGEL